MVTAQAWLEPADTEAPPEPSPVTPTGTYDSNPGAVLFPSSPEELWPQHLTAPPEVTAQA